MGKVVRWLANNWIIVAIVGVTVIASAVTSIAEVSAGEPLATILTGDTLVASLAILASAVTAAIYAKPAYDQAVKLLKPAKLGLEEVTVRDSSGEVFAVATDTNECSIYRVCGPRPCAVTVRVMFKNVGIVPSECIFNLRVPAVCGLRPIDDAPKRHYLSTNEQLWSFQPDVVAESKLSAAVSLLPSGVSITYGAEVSLPDEDPLWESGWPMLVIVRGVNDQEPIINTLWWFS